MKLTGLMKVRNEQWVLGLSLPAALRALDEVVIVDHCSTDRTPEIIAEAAADHPGRVHAIAWDDPRWAEASIQQALLERGRAEGGTHFAVLDADEVITANVARDLRELVGPLKPAESVALPWLAMWKSLDAYRDDDSEWSDNLLLFAFADAPRLGFSAGSDGYDLHQRVPAGLRSMRRPIRRSEGGGVMHLQFAHPRRLYAKHAWYKMLEVTRWPGRSPIDEVDEHYGRAVDDDGLELARVDPAWWSLYEDLLPRIDLGDRPWHEDEVIRLWREHGPDAFEGLDLWGIPQRLERETAARSVA